MSERKWSAIRDDNTSGFVVKRYWSKEPAFMMQRRAFVVIHSR
jgi:hypothetical protein